MHDRIKCRIRKHKINREELVHPPLPLLCALNGSGCEGSRRPDLRIMVKYIMYSDVKVANEGTCVRIDTD